MNKWIQHVKEYASKKGISYTQALKDPNVKKGYKSKTKGGATYGDPDSPPPFSMGSAPATSSSARRPSRRRVRATTPRTPASPGSPASPTESEREEDLIDRADDIWFLIKDLQEQDVITKELQKALLGDIKKILGDTRLDISAKHDALTNVMKEIRQFTDLEDQDEPSADAF